MVKIPQKVIIKSMGRTGGRWFRRWFSWRMMMIFLVILLINAIAISIQEKSVEPAIKDLGARFFSPVSKLNDFSKQAIEKEGLYEKTPYFFKGVGLWILNNIKLILSLYIIYLWIGILKTLFGKLSNVSPIINWFLGFGVFIVIQMLFLLIWTPSNIIDLPKTSIIMIPITSFVNFFYAFPYIFKPVKDIAEVFVGDVDNITNNISNII